ncbi:MAG: extracellular solute-binding protein [Planctomycetota bacterium]
MRTILLGVFAVLIVMSVIARTVVLPQQRSLEGLVDAYFAAGDAPQHPDVAALVTSFRDRVESAGLPPIERFADVLNLPDTGDAGELKSDYRALFARHYREQTGTYLTGVPQLVWSTDANPAREVQMALFRTWHLRNYGEPVDIVTDPSNRQLTKAIVQSVAGAGPDIIEYYGAADLHSLVNAGIALDITDYAEEHGFNVETVFPAARSSIAVETEEGELRQYAYPCNVGYGVLLYHRDMFRQAGVTAPKHGWTFDELREVGQKVMESPNLTSRPRFVVMGVSNFDAALASGGRFFPERLRTHSIYNSPESATGLRAYQDLMYRHGIMPKPAEAASMSASTPGGFGGNATVSAPGLFAQKSIVTYIGGRWEYVTFAIANRDRVILPAIERRLAETDADASEAALLRSARDVMARDVLLPLSQEQLDAVHAALTPEDRARMLDIGVAHIPTTTGTPYYQTAARGAVVNRALKRDDPERLVYAMRFLEFLGSEEYNEQINGAFDSICGRIEYCVDADGVSGPPAALPGLEGFDSPVFAEVMLQYAEGWQLSPYIGRGRMSTLVEEVLEDVQSNSITPEVAVHRIEENINRQILANIDRDERLRAQWIAETGGLDPDDIQPGLRDSSGEVVTIRQQIEQRMSQLSARATASIFHGGDRGP